MINPFLNNETDFDGVGVIGTAVKNTTTDIDLLVSNERLINGGLIHCENAIAGDTFSCQVVDKDGVYYPAGTVLSQWMTNWPAIPDHPFDLITEQAAKIPAGVYLRVKYTSTSTTTDVKLCVGYRLYKVAS